MLDLLEVEEFVKCVWSFDNVDLEFNDWVYQPPTELHDKYKVPGEKSRCKLFCDMLDDASKQWRKAVHFVRNPDAKPITDTGWLAKQNEHKSDLVEEGLPGRGISTIAGGLTWNGMPIVSDFRRWDVVETRKKAESRSPRSVPELPFLDILLSTGSKRRRDATADGPPTKRQKPHSDSQPSPTRWDENEDAMPPGLDTFNIPAGTKLTQATIDPIQLAEYASELFASVGNRRYVTGLFVRGDKISLWYYDHIGAIRSKEFSILDKVDSKLFVLVAAAMSVCDRDHLGFEPLLRPPTDIINPSTVKDDILHLSAKHTVDRSGVQVQNDVSFQVLGDKAIYVQYGIIGRGTVVYTVAPKDTGGLEVSKGKLVAKLSWPVKSRIAEDALIREIRSMIGPTWSKHIPELMCSTTLEKDALGLPRTLMPSLNDTSEERVLRILIAQRAEALAKARSLKEFKAIFLHVVRCHRVVFVKANILHRDLSVNNLLFTRGADDKPLGLLNDWDLGKTCKTETTPETPSARHRMGTAPFMALELLKDDPPPHLYRHDLESFIYILVWCAMHLRLDGTEQSRHPLLESWAEGSWDDVYQAKHALFSNFRSLDPIFRNIQPAFQPILREWVVPLCELLKDIRQQQSNRDDHTYGKIWGRKAEAAAQQANEDAWNETRGGLMTFENFMATIGEDPDIPELADIPQ